VPVAGPAAARYPAGGERLHPLRVQHCGGGFRAFCRASECGWRSGWKTNKSEGASHYFLDPDGHKLELHVGNLAQRLAACRAKPYKGMVFFGEDEQTAGNP
jgi:hypothetical protein